MFRRPCSGFTKKIAQRWNGLLTNRFVLSGMVAACLRSSLFPASCSSCTMSGWSYPSPTPSKMGLKVSVLEPLQVTEHLSFPMSRGRRGSVRGEPHDPTIAGGLYVRKKTPRRVSLADYLAEILKNAEYEKGERLDVIIAEAPDLPGCLTQGTSIEDARKNLVDAIEVWLLSGLRSGEDPPVVNGCQLAITAAPRLMG
jgi:predicted RNase H-like HicB family nuclease